MVAITQNFKNLQVFFYVLVGNVYATTYTPHFRKVRLFAFCNNWVSCWPIV